MAHGTTDSPIETLQRRGCTPEQRRRLVALRARVRQGRSWADGPGNVTADLALDRRLAFARWLVEHGRLSEGGAFKCQPQSPVGVPLPPTTAGGES